MSDYHEESALARSIIRQKIVDEYKPYLKVFRSNVGISEKGAKLSGKKLLKIQNEVWERYSVSVIIDFDFITFLMDRISKLEGRRGRGK